MATPIDKARASVAKAMAKLPAVGLRTDYELVLRRWTEEGGNSLSMDPANAPTRIPSELTVDAPEVIPFSGFRLIGASEVAGGIMQAGDYRVKIVRTASVEAFLSQRLTDPAGEGGEPYPEMLQTLFVINGEEFRPISWTPGPIHLTVILRSASKGA